MKPAVEIIIEAKELARVLYLQNVDTSHFLGMYWESGVINSMIIRVFCSWCAMYVETQPPDGSLSLAA